MNTPSSTSSISQTSTLSSSISPARVLGVSDAEVLKAGFYVRDTSFLINESLSFIVTEAGSKFILGFEDKSTVVGDAIITDKENIR